MAKYKMTVVFEVHEEVEMKYVYREGTEDKMKLRRELKILLLLIK
jgi:hypothetical protein